MLWNHDISLFFCYNIVSRLNKQGEILFASFVIGFHTARIDNLLQTLRFLVADHFYIISNSFLEIVCQDNCENLSQEQFNSLDILREKFHKSCITNLNLNQMHLPFVTNHGVENSPTDKIIILESDRILPFGYFAKVLNELRFGLQITTTTMRKLSKPATNEDIIKENYDFKIEYRNKNNEIGQRNMWSGNTAICKEDYMRIRMDETYKGYGWADSDMTAQTEANGIKSIFFNDIELHLWHPPATYGEGDQKQLFIDNGVYFCKKWQLPLPIWFKNDIIAHKGIML